MNQFAFSGFSASNMISCIADGGDIYQVDYMGNRQLVGKALGAYEELEETTKQYYDKLVELNVIKPQKTPEEMMADMQSAMMSMSEIIAALSSEVKELKTNGREKGDCCTGEDVPEREPKRSRTKGGSGDQRNGE